MLITATIALLSACVVLSVIYIGHLKLELSEKEEDVVLEKEEAKRAVREAVSRVNEYKRGYQDLATKLTNISKFLDGVFYDKQNDTIVTMDNLERVGEE